MQYFKGFELLHRWTMKQHSLAVDFSRLDFEKIDTKVLEGEAKELEEAESDAVEKDKALEGKDADGSIALPSWFLYPLSFSYFENRFPPLVFWDFFFFFNKHWLPLVLRPPYIFLKMTSFSSVFGPSSKLLITLLRWLYAITLLAKSFVFVILLVMFLMPSINWVWSYHFLVSGYWSRHLCRQRIFPYVLDLAFLLFVLDFDLIIHIDEILILDCLFWTLISSFILTRSLSLWFKLSFYHLCWILISSSMLMKFLPLWFKLIVFTTYVGL